jgi:hypothetical protein
MEFWSDQGFGHGLTHWCGISAAWPGLLSRERGIGAGPASAGQEFTDRQIKHRANMAKPFPLRQPDLAALQARNITLAEGGIAMSDHPRRQFFLTPAEFLAAMPDNGAEGARRLLASHGILPSRSLRRQARGCSVARLRVIDDEDVCLTTVSGLGGAFQVHVGSRPKRSG